MQVMFELTEWLLYFWLDKSQTSTWAVSHGKQPGWEGLCSFSKGLCKQNGICPALLGQNFCGLCEAESKAQNKLWKMSQSIGLAYETEVLNDLRPVLLSQSNLSQKVIVMGENRRTKYGVCHHEGKMGYPTIKNKSSSFHSLFNLLFIAPIHVLLFGVRIL